MNYEDLQKTLYAFVEIADNIGIKYKQLKTMEQSGMNNENVYRNTCVELFNLCNEEKKIYKSTILSREDIFKIIGMLTHIFTLNPNQSFEDLLHVSKKFNGYERVFWKLNNMIDYDLEDWYRNINANQNIINSMLSKINIKKERKDNFDFQKSILDNYYLVLESFILKYLETCTDFKNDLIHVKYLIAFLDSNTEKHFIDNDFNFKNDLCLSYIMLGDFVGMPRPVQKINLNQLLFKRFAGESAKILNISDNEISKYQFSILLSEIIMRSIAVFFDEEFLMMRKNQFDNYMKQNYVKYIHYQYAIKCILNIYNSTKKDKSDYKYLSLKPW